jgi:hypothetical protein
MSVRRLRLGVGGVSCAAHSTRRRVRRLAVVVMLSGATVLAVLSPAAFAESCPNAELRVGPSASLPECRAYEQVTPVEKGGGVFSTIPLLGSGADGAPDLITRSFAAIAGLQGNEYEGGVYSTVRGGSGWVTSALTPPASEFQSAVSGLASLPMEGASLDARSGLWPERRRSWPLNRADLFVTRPGGATEDVGTLTPSDMPFASYGYQILDGDGALVGWSQDLSHAILSYSKHLWTPDTTEEGSSLYELIGIGNAQPMLVGLDGNGKLISNCGIDLGGVTGHSSRHNAVSASGNTVFFTAVKCGSSLPVNELFARIDNGQSDARTIAISEPSKKVGSGPAGDCEACDTEPLVLKPANFEGASLDGSKAFFTTEQPLLGGDSTLNLYEYDFQAPAGERVVRVSGGDSTVSVPAAEVQGLVATSEDGSHVYFVAHGVLTSTPNGRGQMAHLGAENLYVFERDAQYPAGRTVFVADLSESDERLWRDGAADATPDGRFLVFTSTTGHLTPDDTSTAAQVFEYDAQTGSILRVSIGQDGYNDNGNTSVAGASILAPGYSQASDPTAYWSNLSVSADGSYVFFQSGDGLTPRALDRKLLSEECKTPQVSEEAFCHPPLFEKYEVLLEELGFLTKTYINNIYEYHDGNVYLISDGRDVSEAPNSGSNVELLGTDASGADVLFTTVDSLVSQDTDTNLDIYDARVDGGFPAPVSPPECSGDGCQGAVSAAPILLSPGSEFQAGGNPPLTASSPSAGTKSKPKVKKKAKKKLKKKATGKKGRKARRTAVGRGHAYGKGGRS